MAREQAIDVTQTDIKVGDILWDTTNCCSVRPYFLKVVGFRGKKTVVLEEMTKAFQTEYFDNDPCYLCMPAEKRTAEFPFVMDWVKSRQMEGKVYDSDWLGQYVRVNLGFNTHLYLRHWNGEPVQGCCD